MKNEKRGIKTGNIFWGLFLVLAAVFLVVSQLGLLKDIGVFSILFAVFWVAILIEGLIRGSFGKILFSLAFLFIIFDEPLGIEAVNSWTVLAAALLGTIGLNLIFKRKKHYYYEAEWKHHGEEKIVDGEADTYDEAKRQANGLEGNKIFFRTSFGSAVKYVNSDNFEFASLECSFGAMKVFFDNAQIQNGNATIELDVSFSGVELYFPKHWHIVNQTDTTFGGLDEKNHNSSTGSPVVTLTGDVNFGGVTIIYV